MNIFSGSRRIATVAAALWVIGWLIAAAAHEIKVYARYDFIIGSNFANLAGFDLYSCPQNTDKRSLDIHTGSGRPIQVTLCITESSINVPQGFILDDPTNLLKDPGYLNAPLDIKQKLFNTHVTQSSNYMSANSATKKAIREKFGVSQDLTDEKENGKETFDLKTARPFDPDKYLKDTAPTINPFAIYDEKATKNAFKIRKEDEELLNKKWWESWRSTYGQGFAVMLGGLLALWIFSMSMGWIVRGFLGIPRGMDYKP
jgi:hypothetical protein